MSLWNPFGSLSKKFASSFQRNLTILIQKHIRLKSLVPSLRFCYFCFCRSMATKKKFNIQMSILWSYLVLVFQQKQSIRYEDNKNETSITRRRQQPHNRIVKNETYASE